MSVSFDTVSGQSELTKGSYSSNMTKNSASVLSLRASSAACRDGCPRPEAVADEDPAALDWAADEVLAIGWWGRSEGIGYATGGGCDMVVDGEMQD